MEQKQKQNDVLIVRNEQTGEIGVVAGLGSDGTPKLTAPKAENKGDFLLFSKQDNALEIFLKNFYRQCKEPHHFGFYRVAAENVEQVIDVFKEMLKDPEANKELLAPHRIDTEKYQKEVQAEQTQSTPEVAPAAEQSQDASTQTEQTKQERQPYQPIDESRINWDTMREVYGIDREALEASGDLKKMLNYGKSDLITVTPHIGGERLEVEARLSFKEMADGTVGIIPHTFRKEPRLDEQFNGHTFTAEDKEALKKIGNMGRVVDLVDTKTGELIPSYISLDRQTNNLESIAVKDVYIRKNIGNTELSKEDMSELRAGRGVKKEIELANGKKFTATLQVNADYRGVEFVPRNTEPRQAKRQTEKPTAQSQTSDKPTQANDEQNPQKFHHRWEDKMGNIRAPITLGGVPLSAEQRSDFEQHKAILVKDMKRDGKGEPYTAYVKYSFEAGKPKFYPKNPDVAQKREVAPTAESRTQVDVNTHGKTNEATKHVGEPLQRGQTQPTDRQQQQQQRKPNKPKGLGV